ncbi:MAG: hypothetical protein ACI82I_001740 [Gammaproteobacteria bacterium]|jgi:hypothetical protein
MFERLFQPEGPVRIENIKVNPNWIVVHHSASVLLGLERVFV